MDFKNSSHEIVIVFRWGGDFALYREILKIGHVSAYVSVNCCRCHIETKQFVVCANKLRYWKVKATFHTFFNEHSNETFGPRIDKTGVGEFEIFFDSARKPSCHELGLFLISRFKAGVDVFQIIKLIFIICSPIMSVFKSAVVSKRTWMTPVQFALRGILYFDPEELQKLGWPEPSLISH